MSRALLITAALLLLAAAPQRAIAEDDARRRVSFQFVDEDVKNVVQAIAAYAEINVVLHPGLEGKVTMHLVEVPRGDALKASSPRWAAS
mgnify:FL=1